MMEIRTEIEIHASPALVWRVLTDFPAHSQWNPFVKSIEGELAVGRRLNVWIAPPGSKGMQFRPTLLAVQPERELRWLGRLGVPGLFDGEHRFLIEPLEADRVRFVHSERFSGILVWLMKSSLDSGTRASFEAMNQALKVRVERMASAQTESPNGTER